LSVASCQEGPEEPEGVTIRAGVAIRDITPSFETYTDENDNCLYDPGEPYEDLNGNGELDSLYVGGFGARQPTGVHDPLWARTLALEVGQEIFTFTSVDTLGFSSGRMEDIRIRVWRDLLDHGIRCPTEHMIMSSTHSHQTPDTIGIFGPNLQKGWDEEYLQLLVDRASESIVEAVVGLQPAELFITGTEAGEGFVVDLRPPDITDPYVGILQARTPRGEVIATLTTIANHPEAIFGSSCLISSDFPHYFREKLEDEAGGTAVYFSADLGMMQSPAKIGDRGFARAQTIGEAYADKVTEALDGAVPYSPEELSVAFLFDTVTLPLSSEELRWAIELDILEGYGEYLYESDEPPCQDSYGCFDVPIVMLRLGDVLTVVTLPGEMTPELVIGGIYRTDDCTGPFPDAPPEPHLMAHIETPQRLLFGLAQAEMGYIYPKMTYDPDSSNSYTNSAGPDTAMYLLTGMTEMLDRLNRD
jgi:hypothetical protein